VHLFTRCIRSRQSKLRWLHFGNCVGMTKSFAGSFPSKGGDDGSARILVLAARQGVKIEPDDNMT
jgi:hypothetical protein